MRFPYDIREIALTSALEQISAQLDGTTNVVKLPAALFHALDSVNQAIAKHQASILLGHSVEFYLDSRNDVRVYLANIESINHNWRCEARHVEGQILPVLFDATPSSSEQQIAAHNDTLQINFNPVTQSFHIPPLVSQPEIEMGESSNSSLVPKTRLGEPEVNRRALRHPKSTEVVKEYPTEISASSQPNRGQIEGAHNSQHTPQMKPSNGNSTERIQHEDFQGSGSVAVRSESLDGPKKFQRQ